MAEEYDDDLEEGGSEVEVTGAAQSLDDLTIEDYMALAPKEGRESFMLTRFPVEMDEFRKMSAEAEELESDEAALEVDTLSDDGPDEDADPLVVDTESEIDAPEEALFTEETGPEVLAPPMTASFEGIRATGWQPPDCTIGVSASDVLLAVNVDLAGYRKNGTLRFRWPNMNTLFRNVLPSGVGLFDPRIIYDHYERKWCVVAAARGSNPNRSYLMVAVSRSSDPRGSYWVYRLDATRNGNRPTNNWADYPMLGFDTQCFYIVSNMFRFGGGFQYCKLRILLKSQLYGGQPVTWYDFWNLKNPGGGTAFTIQPCTHFRGKGGNPPAYMVNAIWPRGNSLTLWTITNPAGYWRGSRPRLSKNKVSCRSYDLPPDALQRGSSTKIETNDSRLLNAMYQFVGGTRRVWTCQTSRISWSGDSAARSCVQWYEIDVGNKRVFQQNRYGASGKYYFFPAIHTDLRRNAYVVFGRSSASAYASLRRTGRRVSDPRNDLQNSALVKAGESPYTGGRWGDYFGICRDGGDARRVWGYGQYAESGGRWGTWVCSMKF
ncbi:MAG: hypothetical protein MI920_34530 [Kiloniellales bacterium]|nr:hypothetical protein [Kiloniellales bacterium]